MDFFEMALLDKGIKWPSRKGGIALLAQPSIIPSSLNIRGE
jgi:hypothetical protein